MRKLCIPALLMGIFILMLTGCESNLKSSKEDLANAVATVNGEAAGKWEYDFYYQQGADYLEQFGIDLASESGQSMLPMVEEDAWRNLIANTLTRQLAAERDINIDDNEAEKLLNEEIIPMAFGGEEAFNEWLNSFGLNREHAKELARLQEVSYRLFEALGEEVAVDEAEARETYETDPKAWDNRLVSHILILGDRATATEEELAAAEAKAQALIQRLNDGEDFAQLAMDESEDTGSAVSGGMISQAITAYDTNFVEEFVSGSFDLAAEGDFSQAPVQSDYGFHIIKVDKINSGFDNLKDSIIETLISSAQNQAYGELLEGAIEQAEVIRYLNFEYWLEGNELYPPAEGLAPPAPIEEEEGEADQEGDEGQEGDEPPAEEDPQGATE